MATTPLKPTVIQAAPKPQMIQAVYGRMVDPHTCEEFTQTPKPVTKITNWMQCQIDAKKLLLV